MSTPKKKIAHGCVLAGAVASLVLCAAAAQAIDPVYANWRGLAIGGYDPVAYFSDGKPVAGSSDFSTEWQARV